MKKSILIALLTILFLAVGYTYAVEVTLLGPKQYIKSTWRPEKFTDSFPGRPGPAKIILNNGGGDLSDSLALATIKINGKRLFGPMDFIKSVNVRQRTVKVIEKNISINEDNSICVELGSRPNAYFFITIVQEINADNAAVIGRAGGTVEVWDTSSPLFGLKVNIPPGAVSNDEVISVSLRTDLPTPPSYVKCPGVAFELLPDGLLFDLEHPVEVTLPYAFFEMGPDDVALVLQYDYLTSSWADVRHVGLDSANNKLVISLDHFSTYQLMLTTPNFRQQVDFGFVYSTDKFPIDQIGNYCKGESAYTSWYFRQKGHGLRCAYTRSRAELIEEAAHNSISSYYRWPIIGGGEDSAIVASKLWLALYYERKPVLLSMKTANISLNVHMVVVFKYEYDQSVGKGYFYVMDPNYIIAQRKIEYNLATRTLGAFEFASGGGYYTIYRYDQWLSGLNAPLANVYSQYPVNGDTSQCASNVITFEEFNIGWVHGPQGSPTHGDPLFVNGVKFSLIEGALIIGAGGLDGSKSLGHVCYSSWNPGMVITFPSMVTRVELDVNGSVVTEGWNGLMAARVYPVEFVYGAAQNFVYVDYFSIPGKVVLESPVPFRSVWLWKASYTDHNFPWLNIDNIVFR